MSSDLVLAAFAALAGLSAGAGAALAWAIVRRDARPQENLAAAIARLETERAKDRLDMAAFIEEAAGIGESIKRHRARIDGAEGARRKREAQEEAQPELELPPSPAMQLEQVRARARALGRL